MAKAENKTQLTEASVEAFLNTVTDEQRADSYRVIEIMQRVTGESPKMWGAAIIGFGVQHLKYDSGREMDWMLVGFSPRKGNLALYGLNNSPKQVESRDKLGKHKTGGGCLYIKRLSDINEDILQDLVASSVEHIKSE